MRLLEQSLQRTAWWMRLVVSFLSIAAVLSGCGSAAVTPPITQQVRSGGAFAALGLGHACRPWFGEDVVAAFCPTEKADPDLRITFAGPSVITQGSESFVTQVAGPPLAPRSELALSVSNDVRGELAVRGSGGKGETLLGRFRDVELRAHRRYVVSFESIRGRPAFVLRDDDDARVASRQVRVPAGYPPQRNLLVPIGPGDCPASAGQSVADPAGDAFYLNAEDRSPENRSADLHGADLRLTRKGLCADFTLGGPVGDGASITTLLRAKRQDRAEQAIQIVFLIRAGVPRVHVLRGFDTTSSSPARAAGYEPRGNHVLLFIPNSLLPSRFRHVRWIADWQVESVTMEGAWQGYDCSDRYSGASQPDEVAEALGVCNLLPR